MLENAKWIIHPENERYEPVTFIKKLNIESSIKKATLKITSLGCYYATIDGERVGNFILAPGFTSRKRVQCQIYDVTKMIKNNSIIEVTVGDGWYLGKINFGAPKDDKKALIAELEISYENKMVDRIVTDESWLVKKDKLRFAELYDGEIYDSNFESTPVFATEHKQSFTKIVNQQGEYVTEQETLAPVSVFTAPNGDTLVDFGQNLTGYFEISLDAKKGDKVALSVCEELDKHGNFYNENYRDAKAHFEYICHDGYNKYKPRLAFWGFRYMRIESFPTQITSDSIKAIVLHSSIKRTGYLSSSSPLLNKLFSNIVWGQKGNFLDIPTDCPQRDERQGWTGDATVFCKTASYNFDVERFFEKWLTDMSFDQGKTGYVPNVVPKTHSWDWATSETSGAVWGDSATIIPYQMYLTYGSKHILKAQYPTMCKYIGYIESVTKDKYLWTGCEQFGDWLALDAHEGSYRGSSNEEFIASAFYYNSVKIAAKTAKIIGKGYARHEQKAQKILQKIRGSFKEYNTQTECALALYFGITEDKKATAKKLADMIESNGTRLKTGFVGTPFLLHALSQNGYSELAYGLLLQEQCPSWLYSVKQGATTIWEHWDGKNENGEFWSKDMNSFNHYAYGSVADWVYEVGCGIRPVDDAPGFARAVIAPIPSPKLEHLCAELQTRHGTIVSKWYYENGKVHYEITTPVPTEIIIDGKSRSVEAGTYKL